MKPEREMIYQDPLVPGVLRNGMGILLPPDPMQVKPDARNAEVDAIAKELLQPK